MKLRMIKSLSVLVAVFCCVITVNDSLAETNFDVTTPIDKAQLAEPYGVVVGPDGHLYICDLGNSRIREFDMKSKKYTTIAGNGKAGYSGDGQLANKAQLHEPAEIRFDKNGDLFIVEIRNHVVRKVNMKTKIISTVAGNGQKGFSGDGAAATKAKLHRPHSITLDHKGNLFIADIGNHRIRKVNLATGIISTIAGNGKRINPIAGQKVSSKNSVLGPRALFVDGSTMWVALREGHSIWKFDLKKRIWNHVAGTGKKGDSGDKGPAIESKMNGPKGVAINSKGIVAVVDTENHSIRLIDTNTGIISSLKYGYKRPHGVCFSPDGNTIYVGDTNSHRIHAVKYQ